MTQVNRDFQGAMLEGHQDHQDDQDVPEPPDLLDLEVSKVEQVNAINIFVENVSWLTKFKQQELEPPQQIERQY